MDQVEGTCNKAYSPSFADRMQDLLQTLEKSEDHPEVSEEVRFATTCLNEERTFELNDRRDPTHGDIMHELGVLIENSMCWIAERERSRSQITDEVNIPRVKMESDVPMAELCGEAGPSSKLNTAKRETSLPGDEMFNVSDNENDDKDSDKTRGAWSDDAESEGEEEIAEDSSDGKRKKDKSGKNKSTTCDVCKKSFSTAGTLRVHKLTHLSDEKAKRPYACDQCPKRFTQAGSLSVHKRKHLDKDDLDLTKFKSSWTCHICGKTVHWRASIYSHMRSHLGNEIPTELAQKRPHKCAQCNRGFAYKTALQRHERVHTGERPFKCDLCPRAFNDKKGLKLHMESHNKGTVRPMESDGSCRNYHCTLCPRRFQRNWQLDAHMMRHAEDAVGSSSDDEEKEEVPDQLFRCGQCVCKYLSKHTLKKHEIEVHGLRPYHCVLCDLHYGKLKELSAHMKKKHDEKTRRRIVMLFQCEHCPAQFRTEFAMDKHSKVHEGPSSFNCSKCNQAFTSFALLEDHKRSAHDPLPYKCKYCGGKFRDLVMLADHKSICGYRISKKNTNNSPDSLTENDSSSEYQT